MQAKMMMSVPMRATRLAVLCSLFLFALVALTCHAASQEGSPSFKQALVLVDDLDLRNTHSRFFRSLEGSGYALHFHEASDPDLELSKFGEYLYDTLILFAPRSSDWGGSVTVDSILNFIDDGNNVLIAGDSEVSESVRELALECGVEFGEDGTFVVDHFSAMNGSTDTDNKLLVCDPKQIVAPAVVTGDITGPVLYRGAGLQLEQGNSLLMPVLRATSTAYVHWPQKAITTTPAMTGTRIALVAALQARNNARVTVSGSLEIFSDKFANQTKVKGGANAEFARNVALWTFGQRGQLRASNVRHRRIGEQEEPRMYTVREDVEYLIDVEQWDGTKWVPYAAKDVQVEFVMLDPYVRIALQPVEGSPTLRANWTVPDVYGVYSLRLEYHRRGYTGLSHRAQVTVRPLRHNQYERFILSAYPYYAGAASVMVALVLFSFIFMYHRDAPKQ